MPKSHSYKRFNSRLGLSSPQKHLFRNQSLSYQNNSQPYMNILKSEPVVYQIGAGIGRQRVDEPLYGESHRDEIVPRIDDSRELLVDDDGEKLLPGDKLKMQLIKKIAREKKQSSKKMVVKKGHAKLLETAAEKIFPLLFKKVAPKSNAMKNPEKRDVALKGLKTLLKKEVKNPAVDKKTATQIASEFIKVFKKMGVTITDESHKTLADELYLALMQLGQSGSGKKSKQFWHDFGKSFLKTIKVGLPIAAIIAPELLPFAAAAELLL